MKKPWLAIGLIAALSVLIVIALVRITGGPSEPEYHGRKLTDWMDDLATPSPLTEANAKLAIQQMGTNAVPFLVQMLYAKDSPFKKECMDFLVRQHWIPIRLHYDFGTRHDAMHALMILGPDGKAAIPDLAEILLNAGLSGDRFTPGDRLTAAYTLSRIGPPALPALENALTNHYEEARMNAATGLGALGDPSSVPNLLAALKDPDQISRANVAMALSNFPGQANVIVPVLIKCLDDPDSTFVGYVARTLGSFGPDARPAIPQLLTVVGGTNYDAGMLATEALMRIDFDQTLATFTNNLESIDVNVRRSAAWALMFFEAQGEPAVPFLVKCLKDPDAGVREHAAGALWRIGADADLVAPALVENLNDANSQVREITAAALGSFGDRAKSAVPQILKLIQENKGNRMRLGELYKALGQIDPKAAAELPKVTP